MKSDAMPGIIESKKISWIFPPNNSNIKKVKNGPIIAPIWSNVLWIPNAFPELDSSTESAINASRGAVLIPLPILSAILTIIVSINVVTKIKRFTYSRYCISNYNKNLSFSNFIANIS